MFSLVFKYLEMVRRPFESLYSADNARFYDVRSNLSSLFRCSAKVFNHMLRYFEGIQCRSFLIPLSSELCVLMSDRHPQSPTRVELGRERQGERSRGYELLCEDENRAYDP